MQMGENGGFCKNVDVIEQIDLCMHNYEETPIEHYQALFSQAFML